jgi:hypothetical protein
MLTSVTPAHSALILGSAVDTWATVFVAVGTVGAVAYALFRDLFVEPRRRPKLELRFDDGGNDQLIVATAEGRDAACVRLRVVNGKRKDTADDVVVMATDVRRLEDSGQAAATPIMLPLTWSGSNPPLSVGSVHPGSERHIDLLHVDWPAGAGSEIAQNWPDTVPVHLDLASKSPGRHDTLEPGRYEVSLEIRARNADAIRYAVPFSWDGKWSGQAAMWEHLRVEPPRRLR